MAKNEVTLTFAGDTTSLERGFDRVGSGADKVGRDVSSSFDRVGESADNLDTRAMGFRDTMTGVEDTGRGLSEIMKGNLFDGVLLLGMGFGDLASGVANFGVQFVKTAGEFIANHARMLAAHLANAARMAAGWLIAMGPIALVIVAIAAVVAILVALGVDFEDVKNAIGAGWEFIRGAAAGVFEWLRTNWPLVLAIITGPIGLAVLAVVRHWGTIKSGFTAVKNWIRDRVSDIVSFITGIPGRIAEAAKSIGSTIINGIKNGITGVTGFVSDIGSAIKGAINSALHLPFTIKGPGPLPDFTIPAFHSGGTFRAPPGRREGLAMLLDGETVSRPGASGAGVTVNVFVAGSIRSDRDLVRVIRDEFARGGFQGALP
jgi:phage-related protein